MLYQVDRQVAPNSYRALRLDSVIQKTGLSRSYIYKLIQAEKFPSPHKITNKISVWREQDIDNWLEEIFLNSSFAEEEKSND